ncbi:MAG: response regulator transcription factor [Anaerolineae bacterium]
MADVPASLRENIDIRLLIVDDEPQIRSALVRALSLVGYQVESAATGQQALALLEAAPCDLMVLDLRLPDLDGVEVMEQARSMQPDLLIIVLTGYATLESAIAAVKFYAADYLQKPASVHDIAAVIATTLEERFEWSQRQRLLDMMSQALETLRRMEAPRYVSSGSETELARSERFVRSNVLLLDRHKRRVVLRRQPEASIELTEGEATILAHLMEHPNQACSCPELAQALLDRNLNKREAQGLIRPYIFRLRQKIEAAPGKPHLIRTIRGRGYLFDPTG